MVVVPEGGTLTAEVMIPNRPGNSDDKNKDDTQSSGSPSYLARVSLTGTSMMVDGREEPLGPGMSVTAEIKTGQRRILDYLLSRLRHLRIVFWLTP